MPGRFLFFLEGGGWFGDIAKGCCCEYKVVPPATNSFLLLEDIPFEATNCDILSSNIISPFIIFLEGGGLQWILQVFFGYMRTETNSKIHYWSWDIREMIINLLSNFDSAEVQNDHKWRNPNFGNTNQKRKQMIPIKERYLLLSLSGY